MLSRRSPCAGAQRLLVSLITASRICALNARDTTMPCDARLTPWRSPAAARTCRHPLVRTALWPRSGGAPCSAQSSHAWCRRTAEHALGAQVLIEVRPVNSVTGGAERPICELARTCPRQPRIPLQGHRDRTTIRQVHGERVFGESHVANSLVSAECQCAHARPPENVPYAPRSMRGFAVARVRGTRSSVRGRWVAARISPTGWRDQRGRAAARSAHG